MRRNTRLRIVTAAIVSILSTTYVAHGGQVVWSEGEEPNILVQWWVNSVRNSLAFWPAVITLCVVVIGFGTFAFWFRRYRGNLQKMKDREDALTNTLNGMR